MKVYLLSHTPEPEKVVAFSAHLCYSNTDIKKTVEKFFDLNYTKKLIKLLKDKGHISPFEHVSFTFGIEGISRVTSHQLVRHRIASYSQQSQRYIKYDKNYGFVIPPSIKNSEFKNQFIETIDKILNLYKNMISNGIPAEDARYIFPNATKTNIIVTMNARSLFNFFELRCCYHAQWEIRNLAFRMLGIVKKIAPNIFNDAGPTCFKGYCREKDSKCPMYKFLIDNDK